LTAQKQSYVTQEEGEVFFADPELTMKNNGNLFSFAGFTKAFFLEQRGIFSFGIILKSSFSMSNLDETSRSLLTAQNAGGSSEKSETLSFDLLQRLFGAADLTMEMNVSYDPPTSKKTDYVCKLFGKRLVSFDANFVPC
jgi:hypothetical protein